MSATTLSSSSDHLLLRAAILISSSDTLLFLLPFSSFLDADAVVVAINLSALDAEAFVPFDAVEPFLAAGTVLALLLEDDAAGFAAGVLFLVDFFFSFFLLAFFPGLLDLLERVFIPDIVFNCLYCFLVLRGERSKKIVPFRKIFVKNSTFLRL